MLFVKVTPDNLLQLTIVQNQHMQNVFNWLKYDATKNLGRLREDVNKAKWSTAPAVLNAFYNPNFNDIGKS